MLRSAWGSSFRPYPSLWISHHLIFFQHELMSGCSFSYRTASHAQLVLTELATATIAISQYKNHAMTSEQCPAWSVCKQRPARRSFEFLLCLEEYIHVVGPYVGVHHGRVCETNALLATTRSKPKTEKDHTYISISIYIYIYLNKKENIYKYITAIFKYPEWPLQFGGLKKKPYCIPITFSRSHGCSWLVFVEIIGMLCNRTGLRCILEKNMCLIYAYILSQKQYT